MKRRKQCPAQPKGYIGPEWQCQRLAEHEGAHQASYSKTSRAHISWNDGDTVFDYKTLPGNVRFPKRLWTEERSLRVLDWAITAVLTAGLWFYTSRTAALVYFALELLLSVRRSHFLDFGRFTIGAWPVPPTAPAPILGIGWVLAGEDRTGPKAGLELTVGRAAVGVFSLMSRADWATYKEQRSKARAGEEPQ
ncbi:hypothetical protein [Streptomyces zaomyceticus]|uniref:hypothetical protein n=1 Tax=Streptomyces zaomyceticus TaxID=68286 RepID=UPI002E1EEB89